jgi:integrase
VVPQHRATIYLVAYYLGLRRAELNRLKRGDFDLDSIKPTVRIPGSVSKNGKAEQFELRPEIVASLRSFWAIDRSPFQWAFYGRVPQMVTFRRDLSRAGTPFWTARVGDLISMLFGKCFAPIFMRLECPCGLQWR